MILIGAKLATDRSKAGDGGLLMTRNQRLDVHPTFLLGKNARPQQFGPPDASCYGRCVDPEVEALGLRSAELGVLA